MLHTRLTLLHGLLLVIFCFKDALVEGKGSVQKRVNLAVLERFACKFGPWLMSESVDLGRVPVFHWMGPAGFVNICHQPVDKSKWESWLRDRI